MVRLLPPHRRLLKLDVNSAKQVIMGDGSTQSLPFFSTELSPEAQEVRPWRLLGMPMACVSCMTREGFNDTGGAVGLHTPGIAGVRLV